jgi:hypothetical protein
VEPGPPQKPAKEGLADSVVGWARAIVLGVRDTAQDMVDEGRRGAHDAYDESWRDFDKKTKFRRRRP